jgi:hypothetical protein
MVVQQNLPSREGKRYEGKRTALFLHPRGVFNALNDVFEKLSKAGSNWCVV